jgi:hypothetical protein
VANPLGAPIASTPYNGPLPGAPGMAGMAYAWQVQQLWWANAAPQGWGIMQDNINALEQGIG